MHILTLNYKHKQKQNYFLFTLRQLNSIKILYYMLKNSLKMAQMSYKSDLKFIDIGANLCDKMYSGVYNGSKKHDPDVDIVLDRSWNAGLEKLIVTGTSLKDCQDALEIVQKDDRLFCTIGCHPTSTNEIATSENPASYLKGLFDLIEKNRKKVVAIGEFGLDYDRLHFSPKEVQIKYFEEQLKAFSTVKLPLFLHCRNAAEDLLSILTRNRECWTSGVVHSFTGSKEEAQQFLDLGLYIGINGCSLKTHENLEVLKCIPEDRLLVETDCPWCEVRPTHAGFQYIKTMFSSVKKEKWQSDKMVKGRNEPATIRHILEIMAGVRNDDIFQLSEQIFNNTNKLFFTNSNI